jgi:hypothetical protein
VGLHLDHGGSERLGTDGEARSARPAREWAILRQRPELLAEGTLACPRCELPIALGARVAASEGLACPYCERHGPANEFLRLGVSGPRGSQVAVIASF